MKLIKKKFKAICLSLFSLSVFFLYALPAKAQNLRNAGGVLKKIGETGGYDPNVTDPTYIVAGVIQAILALLGIIFMILIIYGGYLWMTARGNEERVKKAKDLIVDGVIGFAIVIAAYAITVLVVSRIGGAAGVVK